MNTKVIHPGINDECGFYHHTKFERNRSLNVWTEAYVKVFLTHIHPDTHTWVVPIETRIRVRE